MRIVVMHGDRRTPEVITLTEPLVVVRGKKLNSLLTSTGMQHWFTQDGFYDGWSRESPPDGISEEESRDLIERTEAEREFPDAPGGPSK